MSEQVTDGAGAQDALVGVRMLTGFWEQGTGPAQALLHDEDPLVLEERVRAAVAGGRHPAGVTGYAATGGGDGYTVVLEDRSGPPCELRAGLTSEQYQATFESLGNRGFRLVDLSAYTVHGEDRYAALFEQRDGPALVARHRLREGQDWNTLNVEMVTHGFRLRRINGYRIGQDDRFAVLYEQDGGPPSVERIAMPHSEFRAEVVAMAAFGARLVHISSYRFDGERYTAVWDAVPGPPVEVRTHLDRRELDLAHAELAAAGFRLVAVAGH